jgi:hypothetical protein
MRRRHSWPRTGFETVIPASVERQTQALDRAANGIVGGLVAFYIRHIGVTNTRLISVIIERVTLIQSVLFQKSLTWTDEYRNILHNFDVLTSIVSFSWAPSTEKVWLTV